jgi:N-acetylmuramoyl-L-alanine amidase
MPLLRRILLLVVAAMALTLAKDAVVLADGKAAPPKAFVTEAKIGVEPNLTRLELSLSKAADYRIFALADPARIVIDLSEVSWKVPAGRKLQGKGLVAGLRYGLFKAGTSRIVLDLAGPAAVADARILPANGGKPPRLAIDLRPTDANTYKGSVQTILFASNGAAAPAASTATAQAKVTDSGGPSTLVITPAPKQTAEAVAVPAAKPLIVIDPGHGGIDPGALGTHTMEKNITLAMAKQLQKALLATGRFRVVLTRDKDIFIPLRDRFKIARDQGADLFMSLHADSNPGTSARGASVYTLSDKASDAEAEALATKENKSDVIAGVDLSQESQTVSGILIDLAQRETTNLSSRFASILVGDLKKDTMMLENSHRFAGFAVLKAPDVPSVLLEMGYISNDQDERLLTDPSHQKVLAGSIAHAIEDYFDWRDMIRKT